MKARKISAYVQHLSTGFLGRILVFTGARQTGKTTLTRELFRPYTYLSIEDPVVRKSYAALTASQWNMLYPRAILDEVQKEPLLVESIKSAYDQFPEVRYILPGSSQLLLLEKVRESLAGRCSIIELFPLTVPELETHSFADEVPDSPFQRFMKNLSAPFEYLPSFMLDPHMAEKSSRSIFTGRSAAIRRLQTILLPTTSGMCGSKTIRQPILNATSATLRHSAILIRL